MKTPKKTIEKKYTLTLSEFELLHLYGIMHHFTDYMAHDDREDHGLGMLKHYRTLDQDSKNKIYFLAGKLKRRVRNRR